MRITAGSILTIPLQGELAHEDSAGHKHVIKPNDIQVMSAGTGIYHSEYNNSDSEVVNFLQIWVFPDAKGHEPRYDQKTFDPEQRENTLQAIVTPKKDDGALWLNQNAYFSLAVIAKGHSVEYAVNTKGDGLYLFVVEGKIETAEETLRRRDGIGVWEVDGVIVRALSNSEILFIEVPMNPTVLNP